MAFLQQELRCFTLICLSQFTLRVYRIEVSANNTTEYFNEIPAGSLVINASFTATAQKPE